MSLVALSSATWSDDDRPRHPWSSSVVEDWGQHGKRWMDKPAVWKGSWDQDHEDGRRHERSLKEEHKKEEKVEWNGAWNARQRTLKMRGSMRPIMYQHPVIAQKPVVQVVTPGDNWGTGPRSPSRWGHGRFE